MKKNSLSKAMRRTTKNLILIILILVIPVLLTAQDDPQDQTKNDPPPLILKRYLKASPLSVFGILGIHHERFLNGNSINYVFGYNESSSSTQKIRNDTVTSRNVKSQNYFLIVERRFYGNEKDAKDAYWAPFFEVRLAPEDVSASSAGTDYSHERNRWRLSLGVTGGYQFNVSEKFVIDVFGGVRGGYQFISNVDFYQSGNFSFSQYEELFGPNRLLKKFRWGARLGITMGLLIGSATSSY